MCGGTPEPDATASLMNAFAQLLPIPSTSWSFFHLMSFIRCDTDQCTQPLHHSSQARWLLQLRVPLQGLLPQPRRGEVLALAAVAMPCVVSGCQLVTQHRGHLLLLSGAKAARLL